MRANPVSAADLAIAQVRRFQFVGRLLLFAQVGNGIVWLREKGRKTCKVLTGWNSKVSRCTLVVPASAGFLSSARIGFDISKSHSCSPEEDDADPNLARSTFMCRSCAPC